MRGRGVYKAYDTVYMCNVFLYLCSKMSVTETSRMDLMLNKTNKIIQVRAGPVCISFPPYSIPYSPLSPIVIARVTYSHANNMMKKQCRVLMAANPPPSVQFSMGI